VLHSANRSDVFIVLVRHPKEKPEHATFRLGVSRVAKAHNTQVINQARELQDAPATQIEPTRIDGIVADAPLLAAKAAEDARRKALKNRPAVHPRAQLSSTDKVVLWRAWQAANPLYEDTAYNSDVSTVRSITL
jgi:hypothetical protein